MPTAVTPYHLHATDGDIRHVSGMRVDEKTWSIRYVFVEMSDWWQGHQALVSPQWISAVDWATDSGTVDPTRESVKGATTDDPAVAFDREPESDLYEHPAHPAYLTQALIHEDGVAV